MKKIYFFLPIFFSYFLSSLSFTQTELPLVFEGKQSFFLLSQKSKKAVDIYRNQKAEKTPVIQWNFHGGSNQEWKLVSADEENCYYIISLHTPKALSYDPETKKVVIQTQTAQDEFVWKFVKVSDEQYLIQSKSNLMYLSVKNLSTENWSEIVLSPKETATVWFIKGQTQKKIISGTIYLPDEYPVPQHDIKIQLNIREKRFSGPENERMYLFIPKGERSVSYQFKMPIVDDNITYSLSYICWEKGLMHSGFYSPKGIIPFKKGIIDYDGKEVFRFKLDSKPLKNIDINIPLDSQSLSLEEMKSLAEEKGKGIVKKIIKPKMTDFEKELVVYEWIAQNVKYYNNELAAKNMDNMDEIWGMIIGPILHGIGECSSFAETFQFLMTQAGVKTMMAWKPGHLWNIAKIGENWYTVDTTWNWAGYRWLNIPAKSYPYLSNNSQNPPCEKVFELTDKLYPNKKLLANKEYLRVAGNIYLPGTMKSPRGGMEITLTESNSKISRTFFIAEGYNSAFFMMAVPRSSVKKGLVLSYTIKSTSLKEKGYYYKTPKKNAKTESDLIPYSELDIIGLKWVLEKNK